VTALSIAGTRLHRVRSVARVTSELIRRSWRAIDRNDIAAGWRRVLIFQQEVLSSAQATVSAESERYVDSLLDEYGMDTGGQGELVEGSLAGIASDGRDLTTLLYLPAITALQEIKQGHTAARGMAAGNFLLDLIVRTQVADAARVSDGVALTVRPQLAGWVRMLSLPSCSRCLILAGRFYRWNDGFLRHPRCDCRHIPVAEDIVGSVVTDPKAAFNEMSHEQQDATFGADGAQAIRDGADMAQVVNARKGMTTAGRTQTRLKDESDPNSRVNVTVRRQVATQVAGRSVFTTTAGVRRRVRLMPEAIYDIAGQDRNEAMRLLRVHGYIR
jgi:hypothetical protein